jgi:WD40 repeat protein
MLRLHLTLVIATLSAAVATAQPASFRGPVSGFLYTHNTRTIRPLVGVSGATYMGPPVFDQVDFASVAPDGKAAFLVRAGRSSLVKGLDSAAPTEAAPDGMIDGVDRVVWNRDGSVALLYASSTNRMQRVRLSGAGISADSPLDLSTWGTLSVMAIDSSGRQVAFGVAESGLYLIAGDQSPALLSSMSKPAALAFDGNGRRLFAVDGDGQAIRVFDSGSSAYDFAMLAQTDAPAVIPAGLAVSGDGRYVMLADAAAHTVRVYDAASGEVTNSIALDFAPSRFEAISSAPTFLLNGDRDNEWLLILDARQAPSVSFVPANKEAQ